jgi:Zn ribbon nucleic-acid-binding protein
MQGTFAGASQAGIRDFTCVRCGHQAMAQVVGIGEGAQSALNSEGTAERRATESATADIDTTLSLARCPKCKERDPAAVWRWWLKYAALSAAMLGGLALAGWAPLLFGMNMRESDKWMAGWIVTGIAVITVVPMMLIDVLPKWWSIDSRIEWSPVDEDAPTPTPHAT